jgi:hypothetical protein
MLALAGFAVALVGWRGADRETRRRDAAMMAVGAVCLIVALGTWTPVFPLLVKFVPTFGLFRVPARWSLWCAVAMIFFGCRMVDWLTNPDVSRSRAAMMAGWGTMGLVVVALLLVQTFGIRPLILALGVPSLAGETDPLFVGYARGAVIAALLATGGIALVGLTVLRRPALGQIAAAVIALIGVADLRLAWEPFTIPVGTLYHPQAQATDAPHHRCDADLFRDHFFAQSPPVPLMREQVGRTHFTDTSIGYLYDQDVPGLQAERPASLGLNITRGYQQLRLAGYVEDYYSGNRPTTAGTNTPVLTAMQVADRNFFDAYNVTLLLAHAQLNERAMFARMGFGEGVAAGAPDLVAFPNPNARGFAWLSSAPDFLTAGREGSLGTVAQEEGTVDHWFLSATTAGAAWLHLSSPDYAGWVLTATSDDGEVLEGETSRSVYLPVAGSWKIERRFDRIGLRPSNLLLALLALIAGLWMVGSGRRPA